MRAGRPRDASRLIPQENDRLPLQVAGNMLQPRADDLIEARALRQRLGKAHEQRHFARAYVEHGLVGAQPGHEDCKGSGGDEVEEKHQDVFQLRDNECETRRQEKEIPQNGGEDRGHKHGEPGGEKGEADDCQQVEDGDRPVADHRQGKEIDARRRRNDQCHLHERCPFGAEIGGEPDARPAQRCALFLHDGHVDIATHLHDALGDGAAAETCGCET